MNKEIKQPEEMKKKLIEFTINGVDNFLKENPSLEFYAFAFDCNAEYAEVNLCFNTESDFQKTLKYYKTGNYSENYQSDQDINELKFNTGDWNYQCFDTLYVFTEEELSQIFNGLPDDDYKSWNSFVSDLLNLFTESLLDFKTTEMYEKIPKTEDFIAFCIDHDEDFEDAIARLEKFQSQ